MAFFEWDDSYSVNVAEIDKQHQRLIGLINELHEATEQGKARDTTAGVVDELETILSVLDELVDYTSEHLALEEKYMLRYAYPQYAQHKAAHVEFVGRVQELRRDFDEAKALFPLQIVQFLKDWWMKHIADVDQKLGAFLNERGMT